MTVSGQAAATPNCPAPAAGFKTCPKCGRVWETRDAFLSDPELRLLGYQADFHDPRQGLLLLNHSRPDCLTTLSIAAREFGDLAGAGLISWSSRRAGTQDCPGHCLRRNNLERCPAECDCAFAREIVARIAAWPKQEPSV